MSSADAYIYVGSAGALISAIGAAVGLALRSRSRERLVALREASPEDRIRLVADAVQLFHIPVEGLTRQQQYDLAVRQLEDRNRHRQRFFVLTLVLMLILAGTTITLAMQRGSSPSAANIDVPAQEGTCKSLDVTLNMEVEGDLIPGQRGSTATRFASGRLYQFLLANSSRECTAVIRDVQLEVLAHVDDDHPSMEARTAENHYEVVVSTRDVGRTLSLTPLEGAPRTKWTFNLTPKSEPERFAVQVVPHEFGHAYAMRFLVTWYEASRGKRFTTRSSIYGAFFPKGQAPIMGSDEAFRWRDEQRTQWAKQLGAEVL